MTWGSTFYFNFNPSYLFYESRNANTSCKLFQPSFELFVTYDEKLKKKYNHESKIDIFCTFLFVSYTNGFTQVDKNYHVRTLNTWNIWVNSFSLPRIWEFLLVHRRLMDAFEVTFFIPVGFVSLTYSQFFHCHYTTQT